MIHENFHSAVLKRIEWVEGILTVTFLNDKVFSYVVPDINTYYELAGAASIGGYYTKNIKGKFESFSFNPDKVNYTTMIKMQIIGHLGKDALVKNVNGKTVINFSVAHSERYKNAAGELVEKTTWADCAYWTDKVNVAPYLLKGTLVYVEGQPEADVFTSTGGVATATLRMRVGMVQLLGAKSENAAAPVANKQQAPTTSTPPPQAASAAVDDLPF